MTQTVGYHRTTRIASHRMSALNQAFAADLVAVCLLPVVGLFLTGVFSSLGFADELIAALAAVG